MFREFILGFTGKKRAGRRPHRTCAPTYRVTMMFCVAGFRPGRRGPFVSAKGPKTIDAPSGLIRGDGPQTCGGRTNSPGSNKVRQRIRASLPWTSRQASEQGRRVFTRFRTHGKGPVITTLEKFQLPFRSYPT